MLSMKAFARFIRPGLLGLFSLAIAVAPRAAGEGDRPPSVEGELEEVIPIDLRAMLLENPFVRFLVTVNADGSVADYIATHASHFGLLERAEKRMLRADYSPAISGGVPVTATGEFFVTFFDPEQRAVRSGLVSMPHGSSSMDAAVRWMSEAGKMSLEYGASLPDELDQPLELRSGRVLVMTDAEGRPAEGSCVIEFYINDRGEVRLPRVVTSDNEAVSKSAILTILESQFRPLTRNGHPTYVKVRQPMEFHPGGGSASGE